MSGEPRIDVTLRVSRETAHTIARLAHERNVSRSGLVLQALGVVHSVHDARKTGNAPGMPGNGAPRRGDLMWRRFPTR